MFSSSQGAVQVFMPPNGATVSVQYKESRVVKAMGRLVSEIFPQSQPLESPLES